MTDRDNADLFKGIIWLVILLATVSFVSLVPLVLWGYVPITMYKEYEHMSYVNTTGLTYHEFPYKISPGPSELMGDILYIDDPTVYPYYHIRIIEGPDTGPAIPLGPQEKYNTTQYDWPIILRHHQLNPCVDTRLIIITDKNYFVKEFKETMICG